MWVSTNVERDEYERLLIHLETGVQIALQATGEVFQIVRYEQLGFQRNKTPAEVIGEYQTMKKATQVFKIIAGKLDALDAEDGKTFDK